MEISSSTIKILFFIVYSPACVIFIILFYMTKKSFNASVLPRMRLFAGRFITRKESVLVGFSGGADSVCLLHFLHYLAQEKHFRLAAVHINHGLRGAAATADARFCKCFCKEQNIEFFLEKVNVKKLAREKKLSP